jgi:hypothetical protein
MTSCVQNDGFNPENPKKYIVAYPPVDLTRPFMSLDPREIDIYFHYDSEIGAKTCKAACAHCYFRNRPTFHIPADKALAITSSLRAQGYNIGMAPADSFGDEALMAGDAGSAFRLRSIGTSAWSSGMPLYLPGWEERLSRAWNIGFRSIIITAHEAAGTTVPIRGVTRAPVIVGAVRNIQSWNTDARRFSISTTFTIRRDNCNLELMRKMVRWGVAEKIDLVRFNCFANFQGLPEHRTFEMTREDIIRFFGYLKILQEEFIAEPTQLGISEDWGDAGIEQIYPYLPPIWQERTAGWCRAGYRLFAMIEVDGEIVLTGCVDKWDPILGRLIETSPGAYSINWDITHIEEIRRAVLDARVYACWGGVGSNRPADAGFAINPTDEVIK